jgi:hypothetical protein
MSNNMEINKILDFMSATFQVAYDKITDYTSYCTSYPFRKHKLKKDDNIEDYGLLVNDSMTDEKEHSRVFKSVGILKEYSIYFGPPTHIIDNIYLGSAHNAASLCTLRQHNIKVIVNVSKELRKYFIDQFQYQQYEIYDNNKTEMNKDFFEKGYRFIKEEQEKLRIHSNKLNKKSWKGNILIHCFMGKSRSASLMAYYVMRSKGLSQTEALKFIKSKRLHVNPTWRLMKDLRKSTMEIKDDNSIGDIITTSYNKMEIDDDFIDN